MIQRFAGRTLPACSLSLFFLSFSSTVQRGRVGGHACYRRTRFPRTLIRIADTFCFVFRGRQNVREQTMEEAVTQLRYTLVLPPEEVYARRSTPRCHDEHSSFTMRRLSPVASFIVG